VVRPGRVILEVGGVSRALAKEALRLAAYKLPIKTQFIAREEAGADEGHAAAV
jgi:large subunit ribosomal protein L16